MTKRILVPLDGSTLGEHALTIAGELAESLDGVVQLVRVVPPPAPSRFYAPTLREQVLKAHLAEAEAYLAEVAQRLRDDRLHVETHVLPGEVARALVGFAERQRCYLIVMSSHGMGGLGSQVFGSVGQKVLYSAGCPVLIVRPPAAVLDREEETEEGQTDAVLLGELQVRR